MLKTMTLEELVDVFFECFREDTPSSFSKHGGDTLFDRMDYFDDFKTKLIQSGNCPMLVDQAEKQATHEYSDMKMAEEVSNYLKKNNLLKKQ